MPYLDHLFRGPRVPSYATATRVVPRNRVILKIGPSLQLAWVSGIPFQHTLNTRTTATIISFKALALFLTGRR